MQHSSSRSASRAARQDRQRGAAPGRVARGAPEAPAKSAARLAAEDAFITAGHALPADTPPVVVVRRGRSYAAGAGGADGADGADATGATGAAHATGAAGGGDAEVPATPQTELANRASRVFRVDTASTESPPVPRAPTPAQPARRARRDSTNRRPGPVLQVFQAPIVPQAGLLAPAMRHDLARLEPVFVAIRQAQSLSQSFALADAAVADAWQRLSQAAANIATHIDAALAAA